jgi:hypothetical protein
MAEAGLYPFPNPCVLLFFNAGNGSGSSTSKMEALPITREFEGKPGQKHNSSPRLFFARDEGNPGNQIALLPQNRSRDSSTLILTG